MKNDTQKGKEVKANTTPQISAEERIKAILASDTSKAKSAKPENIWIAYKGDSVNYMQDETWKTLKKAQQIAKGNKGAQILALILQESSLFRSLCGNTKE
ncbi:MAG: hypothetical protein WC449_05235 [Candidatus Paceibacterota bacterium]